MRSDNRGLFEVFKKGERDDLSFWGKLKYWFTNVYWCNYKGLTFLGLFGIVCAIVLVINIASQEDYDVGYIMAGDVLMEQKQLEGVKNFIAENSLDANEDDEKTANGIMLTIMNGESRDQMSDASDEKLGLSFADDDVLLYIVDQLHMEAYAMQGSFEPLSTFGIKSDAVYCPEITDSKLFKELKIPEATGGWYIGIKVIANSRDKDEEIMRKYDAAAAVVKAFLEK